MFDRRPVRCSVVANAAVILLVALTVALLVSAARAETLATSFTYQGALNFQGQPLNGTADFQFALFDAVSRGNQAGSTIPVNALPVNAGSFAVSLDFGVDVFNGDARYLEIAVRSPAGSGPFTTLAPRTTVSATPYALQTRGIFVNEAGQVSIGPAEPKALVGALSAQFRVTAPTSNTIAIHGKADALSGIADGVKGTSRSSQGRGVIGEVTASSGSTVGVLGTSDSPTGEGVRGEGAKGVCGATDDAAGVGVAGEATGSGASIGISGTSTSPTGEGVHGDGATGVCGESDDAAGVGVVGAATGSGASIGVSGTSASPTGEGVHGEGATGVCGESDDSFGIGVLGATMGPGVTIGVSGVSTSPMGEGVHGEGATGVCGVSLTPGGAGVLGQGNTGVCGQGTGFGSAGVEGLALTNEPETAGVRGKNTSVVSNAAGVVAEGNGAMGPGTTRAAALDVRNGAILVSGTERPAGTVTTMSGSFTDVQDNTGDTIGRFMLVDLSNDLIVPDSIILVTFEKTGTPATSASFSTDIYEKTPGEATIRIMRHGNGTNFDGKLHYLIINPSPL